MPFEKTVPKVSWSVVYVCMIANTFCEMIAQKNLASAPELSKHWHWLQSALDYSYQHLAQKGKFEAGGTNNLDII